MRKINLKVEGRDNNKYLRYNIKNNINNYLQFGTN